MQIICQREDAFTIVDVKEYFSEKGEPSDRTIERCLNHLAEQGFLTCERKGNKKFYFLSSDPFNDFSDTQFLALAAAADFHRNVIPPATCGHYLLDYIKRRMNEEYAADYDSLFLFKHYHLGQILDDSILWELLQCGKQYEDPCISPPDRKIKKITTPKASRKDHAFFRTDHSKSCYHLL